MSYVSVWLGMELRYQCTELGDQCDLGSLVIEDSRYSWTCSVGEFAHCVMRIEYQGTARFGGHIWIWD